MVITQEESRRVLELMEKLARAHVEVYTVACELHGMGKVAMARRLFDQANVIQVEKMKLRESIAE